MSTTTITTKVPFARRRTRWSPRLAGAEFLKLRKRRGLVVSALVLTVVPMLVAYVVLAILHATNPASYGPPGSLQNFSGSMEILTQLSAVAAILVGATLGAGDLGTGVFRELVVTGRSRLASSQRACPRAWRSCSRSSVAPSRSRRRRRPCLPGQRRRRAEACSYTRPAGSRSSRHRASRSRSASLRSSARAGRRSASCSLGSWSLCPCSSNSERSAPSVGGSSTPPRTVLPRRPSSTQVPPCRCRLEPPSSYSSPGWPLRSPLVLGGRAPVMLEPA